MRQPQKSPKRKTRAELNEEGRERKRQKKHRGHVSGSRSNVAEQNAQSGRASNIKDPRIGSKKPIALIAETPVQPKEKIKPKVAANKEKLSPEKELELLENDDKLDALLERLEDGETLTKDEQKYVDNTLDRIDELMVLLGIELEDESEDDEMFQTKQPDIVRLLKQKD